MRLLFLIAISMLSYNLYGQNDTLAVGVYPWAANEAKPTKTGASKFILEAVTSDLKRLRVHSSVLNPGITNHPPVAYTDKEELLIVRSGVLTVTLNDVSKQLGAGSVVLMEPGDLQSCTNNGTEPASYFVLAFVSKEPLNMDRAKNAGGSEMHDWNTMEVKETDKGYSRPIIRKATAMFPMFDIHATTLHQGKASHAPHTHRNEEVILLMEGAGEMFIAGKTYYASAGDLLYVSPLVPHNFTNTGTAPVTYFAIQWQR